MQNTHDRAIRQLHFKGVNIKANHFLGGFIFFSKDRRECLRIARIYMKREHTHNGPATE